MTGSAKFPNPQINAITSLHTTNTIKYYSYHSYTAEKHSGGFMLIAIFQECKAGLLFVKIGKRWRNTVKDFTWAYFLVLSIVWWRHPATRGLLPVRRPAQPAGEQLFAALQTGVHPELPARRLPLPVPLERRRVADGNLRTSWTERHCPHCFPKSPIFLPSLLWLEAGDDEFTLSELMKICSFGVKPGGRRGAAVALMEIRWSAFFFFVNTKPKPRWQTICRGNWLSSSFFLEVVEKLGNIDVQILIWPERHIRFLILWPALITSAPVRQYFHLNVMACQLSVCLNHTQTTVPLKQSWLFD